VAVFERERASGEDGLAAGPSPDELADSPGLGDQGELSGAVAVLPSVVGGEALPGLVFLGDPFEVGAGDPGGLDVQAASGPDPELRSSSDQQCRLGGTELEDPDDQEESLRVPQSGELQDVDLLSLRRPKSLPCHPKECLKNLLNRVAREMPRAFSVCS